MKRLALAAITLAAIAVPFLLQFPTDASAASASPAALQTAPDFKLTDLRGNEISMSRLRGKVVVVNFWATWCPPCRHEIPWFIEMQKKYGSRGLEIVGISLDSASPAEVAEFAKSMGINYKLAMGNQAIAARFGGVEILPSTFYIGRDGRVIRYVPGLISKEQIEALVTRGLDQPSVSSGRSTR